MNIVEIARKISHEAHKGQYRNDGFTPYIEHPEAVWNKVKNESEEIQAVALLHDTIEDDPNTTEQTLRDAGLPETVIAAVKLLTKSEKYEPYMTYLARVKENPIALKVKIADMLCNLADDPTPRQVEKYRKGMLFLQD